MIYTVSLYRFFCPRWHDFLVSPLMEKNLFAPFGLMVCLSVCDNLSLILLCLLMSYNHLFCTVVYKRLHSLCINF